VSYFLRKYYAFINQKALRLYNNNTFAIQYTILFIIRILIYWEVILMRQKIYLTLAVLFWGWSFVFTKIMLGYMSPVEVLGIRLIIGLPFLYLIIFSKKIKLRFEHQDRKYIIIGAVIITIHFLVQIVGIDYTTATKTGWILGSIPLIIAVLSYFILKERVGTKVVVGIIIATIGIVVLISNGKLNQLEWVKSIGDWLILVSAFTWAFYTITIRNVARKYNPLAITFSVFLPMAVLVVGIMIITSDWNRLISIPTEPIVASFINGLFCLAMAHWFWQEGVAKLGATKAGVFLYLEPLATTALAVPYLGEHFGIFTALGGGLVLVGVFIAEKKKRV
jgi:drug/metabolite transporter (DMT)-like permease